MVFSGRVGVPGSMAPDWLQRVGSGLAVDEYRPLDMLENLYGQDNVKRRISPDPRAP